MARIIVLPDAAHLEEGIICTILYAEEVAPAHLDDSLAHRGVLGDGATFLEKPFTRDQLLGKVRKVLDASSPGAA